MLYCSTESMHIDEEITTRSDDDNLSVTKEVSRKNSPNGHATSALLHTSSACYTDDSGLSYPLDIVVQKIHNVVSNQSVDSSDDEYDDGKNTTSEINHALKLQGFKVTKKDNGADCEIVTFDQSVALPSTSSGACKSLGKATIMSNDNTVRYQSAITNKSELSTELLHQPLPLRGNVMLTNHNEITPVSKSFKKGHRRAYSMPNAHRERAVLVVADDRVREEGARKRHVVRYRLHPYKPSPRTDEAVNNFIDAVNDFSFSLYDPSDELEMEIDESEIICNDGKMQQSFARKFWEAKWKRQNFEFLPEWLQDNEFLRTGHRPPLASFTSCFKSIFSLHTETGNIWTHMYGCVAFIGVAAWFLSQPSTVINWKDKVVFAFFFGGAITCLGFSFTFHTLQCHSEGVAGLFSKLDYSGISMLIVGSFVPWIYYSFYCRALAMTIYISMITFLGFAALIVSLWDKFAAPKYRALRGGVFLAMGLSSVIPAMHLMVTDGFSWMFNNASLHWLLLMGALYIIGACVYMTRFPERCCPGRCDYFFFHMFVIIAAFVHFHGITEMAMKRLEDGSCTEQLLTGYGTSEYRNTLDRWFRPY